MYARIYLLFLYVIELDSERAKVGLDMAIAFPQATPASKFPPCGKTNHIFLCNCI